MVFSFVLIFGKASLFWAKSTTATLLTPGKALCWKCDSNSVGVSATSLN